MHSRIRGQPQLAEGVQARMVHIDDFDQVDLEDVDLVNLRMCR